jgi:hypothetical protein
MQKIVASINTVHPNIGAEIIFLRDEFSYSAEGVALVDRVPIFRCCAPKDATTVLSDEEWGTEMTEIVNNLLGKEFFLILEGGVSPSPPSQLSELSSYQTITLSDDSEIYLLLLNPESCRYFLRNYSFQTLDALWCNPSFVERVLVSKMAQYNDLFGVKIVQGSLRLPNYLVGYLLEEKIPLILQPYDLLDTGDPIVLYNKEMGIGYHPDPVAVRLPEWGWTIQDGVVTFERDS